MLLAGTPLDIDFTTFVNNLIQGKPPRELAPFYASANLIAIKKKKPFYSTNRSWSGNKKTHSKTVFKKSHIKSSCLFETISTRIGVPDAIETIIHGLNNLLQGIHLVEKTVFLLLDLENAFNNIGRQIFIDEVFRFFPEISHWIECTYGCNALLFTGNEIIYSCIGVQQGDPLGPLLFCLVLQLLLLQVNKEFPGASTPGYLDDL
jgi:hypothetical protein